MGEREAFGLPGWGARRESLDPRAMAKQTEATKGLVVALRSQLERYQARREGCDIFDAFFNPYLQKPAVMAITSTGPIDEPSSCGLFLYIHGKVGGRPEELLGLQTAKSPEMISEGEVLWLSGYKAEELNELAIAKVVSGGIPISRKKYMRLRGEIKLHMGEVMNGVRKGRKIL
jgi:hypothetical protein